MTAEGSGERHQQAIRLEALGQLASGIAHDFNNILSVILSYGALLREQLPAGQRGDVEALLRAAERGAGLTRQLLDFLRDRGVEGGPTDLGLRLSELHLLLGRTLGEDIEVSFQTSDRPCVAAIDPVQFDQVALNLVVNARDAMPSGGRLGLALRVVRTGVQELARLEVSDTGVGMDESTRRRIFDPSFTTKAPGAGTGLGLANCARIVHAAGGTLTARSKPGRGSTFVLELPLSRDEAPTLCSQAPAFLEQGSGELVLLVEDSDALREVVRRVLERAGFRVEVAARGDEALALLVELGAEVDVLLSDVVLPGCSGFELAKRAAQVAPHAAILLTSGYVDQDAAVSTWPILWKPIAPSELLREVVQALKVSRHERLDPLSHCHDLGKLSVLVLEDDPALGAALSRVLGKAGVEVVVADTLAGARRAMDRRSFEVLLLDLNLPDGNGLDLLPTTRKRQEAPRVVVLSGSPSALVASLLAAGDIQEHLEKPVHPDQLLGAVARAGAVRLPIRTTEAQS